MTKTNEALPVVKFERLTETKAWIVWADGSDCTFKATSEARFESQLHSFVRAGNWDGYELVEVAT